MIVPWEEALAMVGDGRIEDAKTMLALTICDRVRRLSQRNETDLNLLVERRCDSPEHGQ